MNVLGMQIGKGWGKRVYKRERRDALLFIFKFNRRYIMKKQEIKITYGNTEVTNTPEKIVIKAPNIEVITK